MSEQLFPSGPWVGFYNYSPADKHRMELELTFAEGRLAGDGRDDVGRFVVKGRYDAVTLECWWTKTYPGSHDVFYRGFREGKGIWGTWEITPFDHGGFHIWPRGLSEEATEAVSAEAEQPAELVSAGTVILFAKINFRIAAGARGRAPSHHWSRMTRPRDGRRPHRPLILGPVAFLNLMQSRLNVATKQSASRVGSGSR